MTITSILRYCSFRSISYNSGALGVRRLKRIGTKLWTWFNLVAILIGLLLPQSTDAEALRDPTPKELHNAFELPSTLSQKFDSQRWKNSQAERWTMLFDLPQSSLYGKSKDEGRALLGQPDTPSRFSWRSHSTDLYSLGDCGSESVFLEVSYNSGPEGSYKSRHGGLFCFRLMYVPNGRSSNSNFGWVTNNVSGEEAAARLNENYCLVGMPVVHLCQIMGHPQRLKGTEFRVCGVFQLEYTADKKKVKRFRIFYREPSTSKMVPSNWQDQDLRPDPRCFTDAISALNANITGLDLDFLKPAGMFSSELWKNAAYERSRPQMLFDLCTSYRMIGMNRSDVHNLLGEPDLNPTICEFHPSARAGAPEPPSIDQNSEWYVLTTPMYCGNPPTTFFQLLYENDRVKMYRIDARGGSDGGTSHQRFGNIKVAQKVTATSPAPEGEVDKFEPKLFLPRALDERHRTTGRAERTLPTLPAGAPKPDPD